MTTGIQLEEFKIPNLPDSFDKGLDMLKDFGKSAIEKTTKTLGNVGEKIREKAGGIIEGSNSEGEGEGEGEGEVNSVQEKPVDFNSIAKIDGDVLVFGGLMPLPGSYTESYKTPCQEGQYNSEVQEYLESVRDEQGSMSQIFTEIGGFLNFNTDKEREIFIRKNPTVTCTPKLPKKNGRKTRKIGETCVDDRECIVTDTRNKPKCEKVMRDKYLTGICGEIILGEGDKCEKSEDCKSDLLQCVNKKCSNKKRRVEESGSNRTRKNGRVNTSIPLQEMKGLGTLIKR